MGPPAYRVRYADWTSLDRDLRQYLERGAFRLGTETDLPAGTALSVAIVAPSGLGVELTAHAGQRLRAAHLMIVLEETAQAGVSSLRQHVDENRRGSGPPAAPPVTAEGSLDPAHALPIDAPESTDTPSDDSESKRMPLRRKIGRMTTEEKIHLALTGNRTERIALAKDGNRSIHHYLLKNQSISSDEIALMARSLSTNPEVLEKIADSPGMLQNPAVVRALVLNPKTKTATSLRLLDRLNRTDLQSVARSTGAPRRLVAAAKRRLEQRI